MPTEIQWRDEEFKRLLADATADGIAAATVLLHTRTREFLNRSNPRGRQSKKNDSPSLPGEPPKARTGFGRDNVVMEVDRQRLTGRVGITLNAIYMFFLNQGISGAGRRHNVRIAARPWMLPPLINNRDEIARAVIAYSRKRFDR